MVEKVEGTETPEVETPEVETPEAVAPTAEEQLATLQEQINTLTKERDEKDRGLKTAHSRLTEKDKELRRQADVQSQIDGLTEAQRMIIGALQERDVVPDDETLATKRTDYLKGFDDYVKRQKQERDAAQVKAQQDEYNQKADAIYARAKEAFGEDEDSLFQVRTFLMNGADDLAEKKVAKAESKATDTKGGKVESEEERIERLAEEKLRQKMQEKGMLESETGGPSGVTSADADFMADFGAGKLDVTKETLTRYNKIKEKYYK